LKWQGAQRGWHNVRHGEKSARGKDAPLPEKSSVDGVIKEAKKEKMVLFVKDNLAGYYPELAYKEFPA